MCKLLPKQNTGDRTGRGWFHMHVISGSIYRLATGGFSRRILKGFLIVLPLLCQAGSEEPAKSLVLPAKISPVDTNNINKLVDRYFEVRISHPQEALMYLLKAQQIAEALRHKEKTALVFYHKGYLYRSLGINNLAIQSYLEALDLFRQTGNSNLSAWVLIDIGNLYFIQETKLPLALEHFNEAAKIFGILGNKKGMTVATNNMGLTYRGQGEVDTAMACFSRAAAWNREMRDGSGLALSLSYIGQTYMLKNLADSAFAYFNRSYHICKDSSFVEGLAFSHDNFAGLALHQGDFDDGMAHYRQSLEYHRQNADKVNISILLQKMGATYGDHGEYKMAIDFTEKALQVADSNNLINQRQSILPMLSAYYAQLGNFDRAYNHLKTYIDLRQSGINRNMATTQTEYEMEIRRREAALFEKNTQLQDSRIRQQKQIITIATGFSLTILFMLAWMFRKNLQLKEAYRHLFHTHQQVSLKEQELQQMRQQNRYATSTLSREIHRDLLQNLTALIDRDKPYLKNDITIDDLAKTLNTNRTYLSQIINERFGANFNHYINEYRIREAKIILVDVKNRKLTIEAIAGKVGFNSKSTFNTAFRKFTGLTPSQYVRIHERS